MYLSTPSSSSAFTSDDLIGNVCVPVENHLSFSNHIPKLSRSCLMPPHPIHSQLYNCYINRPLKTRLPQLTLFQPRIHPNKASAAHPKNSLVRAVTVTPGYHHTAISSNHSTG